VIFYVLDDVGYGQGSEDWSRRHRVLPSNRPGLLLRQPAARSLIASRRRPGLTAWIASWADVVGGALLGLLLDTHSGHHTVCVRAVRASDGLIGVAG
jgi:hypothetical protein